MSRKAERRQITLLWMSDHKCIKQFQDLEKKELRVIKRLLTVKSCKSRKQTIPKVIGINKTTCGCQITNELSSF